MKKRKLMLAVVMTLALCMPAQTVQAELCSGPHNYGYACGGPSGGTVGGITHSYSGGTHLYGKTPHYRDTYCFYCDFESSYKDDHDYMGGHIYGCGMYNGCSKYY